MITSQLRFKDDDYSVETDSSLLTFATELQGLKLKPQAVDISEGEQKLPEQISELLTSFDGYKLNFAATNPFPQTGHYTLEYSAVYLGFSYDFGNGKNRSRNRKYREHKKNQYFEYNFNKTFSKSTKFNKI